MITKIIAKLTALTINSEPTCAACTPPSLIFASIVSDINMDAPVRNTASTNNFHGNAGLWIRFKAQPVSTGSPICRTASLLDSSSLMPSARYSSICSSMCPRISSATSDLARLFWICSFRVSIYSVYSMNMFPFPFFAFRLFSYFLCIFSTWEKDVDGYTGLLYNHLHHNN